MVLAATNVDGFVFLPTLFLARTIGCSNAFTFKTQQGRNWKPNKIYYDSDIQFSFNMV